MALHDESLVTNEVVAALRASSGRPVGDGEAPAGATFPYHVVHLLPSPPLDGSWGDPHEQAVLSVQVNSIGTTREEAQFARHRARLVLLGRTNGAWSIPLTGDGWRVFHREHDGDGGVERTDDLFTAPDRFRLHVAASTPAPPA